VQAKGPLPALGEVAPGHQIAGVRSSARTRARGEEAAAALREAGGDAHAVTLDVTDPATVQAAAELVEERFGHLDVLINNAGISGSGRVSPADARP
jgi:NAD(P)-dependent dehydrogenase (short-subunit alcohol dehydrogenase family)